MEEKDLAVKKTLFEIRRGLILSDLFSLLIPVSGGVCYELVYAAFGKEAQAKLSASYLCLAFLLLSSFVFAVELVRTFTFRKEFQKKELRVNLLAFGTPSAVLILAGLIYVIACFIQAAAI